MAAVQSLRLACISLVLWGGIASIGRADESHARYFEQLRQRGLFSLAESDAISRLAGENLSLATETELTIELSRTLAEHARFAPDAERDELWERAQSLVQDLIDRDRTNPRSILLAGQLASVAVSTGEWLRGEAEVRPFDASLRKRARSECKTAVERLQELEKQLAEPGRDASVKKPSPGSPAGYELRILLHQVRWQLSQTWCLLAELASPNSAERTANAANAEQVLRRLKPVTDEPIQSRTKLLQITAARLKGDLDRAAQVLSNLEKSTPKPADSVLDEITVERVRLLLEQQQPTEAAELLLKTRNQRQRLTGELWFLQTRALIALRDITLEKQQETLAERLGLQITTTIERCEEQVGGYWGRRCRQAWDAAQTARKYGLELDTLMQQARLDFTSGQIEAALAEYSQAEDAAQKSGQTDLAHELGFTRASILLDQKQYEAAATEFFRLAQESRSPDKGAKSHLLGAYALGRFYDEMRTSPRREAYTEALDRHLKEYATDPTVNEARFFKGQLEEQRQQATLALPLYLEVDPRHPRAADAVSGAARCYETILRRMIERRLPTADFEREAIDRLSRHLAQATNSVETWTATQADVALRLSAILLRAATESSLADETESETEREHGNSLRPQGNSAGSSRLQQATVWLTRVNMYLELHRDEPATAASTTLLRQRAIPLQIIVLAGKGKLDEAEELLKSLKNTSPELLLAVMEGLSQFISSKSPATGDSVAALSLRAGELLGTDRDQLAPVQRSLLDQYLTTAYLATGQTAKAVNLMKSRAEQGPKDVEIQREIGLRLSSLKSPEAATLSKQCWRRVESLTKGGSAEWFVARLEVLRACLQLNQVQEGRKLLQVTKVLYPDLGGKPLADQFEAIDRALPASAVPGK